MRAVHGDGQLHFRLPHEHGHSLFIGHCKSDGKFWVSHFAHDTRFTALFHFIIELQMEGISRIHCERSVIG